MSFPDEAHLLLVEPDAEFRKLLSTYLGRHGFWITGARSPRHAARLLEGLAFDMVLLSVAGPPDADALSLPDRSACPVMGIADAPPTAGALEKAGAIGSVTKPFSPEALLERINLCLDRTPATRAERPKRLRLGELVYDVERGEMWDGETPVRLTATESLLMRIFAARPGEPLSRARLVADLGRGGGQAQERAVDVQITRLRRKIEPDPKSPRYLQTVRGAGYLFAPD